MRYPAFLRKNGTIGFVAPSFGCATEPYKTAFLHAQEKWRAAGYGLTLGPNCYAEEGIGISNTPEKCGRELTDMYCRADSDVLISCGGGELMCGILDYVDFDRIKEANPKWYMGFSDNTNFTFLQTTLCDTASMYGPCAASFGMEPQHESIADAWALLTGEKRTMTGYDTWERESLRNEEEPLAPYNLTEPVNIKVYPASQPTSHSDTYSASHSATQSDENLSFSGRLLGGCMDCLVNLLGTKYDRVTDFTERYKDDGILWFLEACDLNVMSIRRAMWQMEHAGWFEHCSGFLIGRPLCFGQEMMGMDQYLAVYDALEKYHVPVVMDVDLGHLPPMMPLICGSYATVTTQDGKYQVAMELR